MRVTRLLIEGFRGWAHLDLRPRDHVLLAGVPRAGRTDIIAALARVLDPTAPRTARLSDLHQRLHRPNPSAQADAEAPACAEDTAADPRHPVAHRTEFAQIEVTLADLDPDVQQLFDGLLEPLDAVGCASEDFDADPEAPHCIRLAYRLNHDREADTLDPVVFFPIRSNPATGQYTKVPAATRRALPVISLAADEPMQLRAGGNLRHVIDALAPNAPGAAFQGLHEAVARELQILSNHPTVADAVNAVLNVGGTGARLGDTAVTANEVGFLADDGSVSSLLRTLQPAMHLDDGGLLGLTSHGSTTTAVLSVAEATLLASVPGAIVLADDFGDRLDAAAAEHLAATLRARCGQVWLSTRRPEAARAFEPAEVVRLTRHDGRRAHHQLARITDRKALSAMRQLHTQLLPALTAPTIAVTEGPHDVTVLSAVDRRYPPDLLPLSAYGVRLVAAGMGQEGGIDQMPRVAQLARQLGFRVLSVIDHDKDTPQTAGQVTRVRDSCDVVIRLPNGAIERATLAGISLDKIRAASAALTEYGIPDPATGRSGEAMVTEVCKVVHKQGLHEQLLDALYLETEAHPPLIARVLHAISAAAQTTPGQNFIELDEIPRPAAGV